MSATVDTAMLVTKGRYERKQARADGSRFYFTGKACSRGHVARRYTANAVCEACLAEANRSPRAKEREAAYRKSGLFAEASRRYHERHPEARRRYYQTDAFKSANARRNRSAEHRAYVATWAKKNRSKTRAFCAAYAAAKINATPPWLTADDRAAIASIYAEAAARGLTVDHIVPLRGRGVCGLHVPWNLQLLSASENSRKGNRWDGAPVLRYAP